jgi:MFS family permease
MTDRGVVRTVAALAGLNLLSYVDRQLLVALAPLLMADLGLSRADVGLLIGVSFMAAFALATLASGVLADRFPRPRLMAGGLAAWSAATALTGTAGGFASLAAWRALVGLGEASVPPSALSMLGDRVPPARIGVANGIFYAGVPVGFALSFALAAAVAPRLGWRACFLLLGAAGLVGVFAVWRMADPPRRGVGPGLASGGLAAAARAVAARPALLGLVAAGTLVVFASASSQHAITWLVHERGFDYPTAALLSAIVTGVAGLAGSLGIGVLTDRAETRRPGGRLLALAGLGAAGLAAAAVFYHLPPSSVLFLPCWGVAQAWMLGWFGPFMAAIDEAAPAGRRATVVAFAVLVVNVLGVASGPYVTGLVGDRAGLTAGLSWSLVPAAAGLGILLLVGLHSHSEELRRRPATRNPPSSRP